MMDTGGTNDSPPQSSAAFAAGPTNPAGLGETTELTIRQAEESEAEDSESVEEDTDGGSMMDTGGTNDSPPQSSAAFAAGPTTPAGLRGTTELTTRQAFDQARSSLRESVGKKPRSSAPPALHHAIQPVPSTAEKQMLMQMQMQKQMQALEERMKVREPPLLSDRRLAPHFVFV